MQRKRKSKLSKIFFVLSRIFTLRRDSFFLQKGNKKTAVTPPRISLPLEFCPGSACIVLSLPVTCRKRGQDREVSTRVREASHFFLNQEKIEIEKKQSGARRYFFSKMSQPAPSSSTHDDIDKAVWAKYDIQHRVGKGVGLNFSRRGRKRDRERERAMEERKTNATCFLSFRPRGAKKKRRSRP